MADPYPKETIEYDLDETEEERDGELVYDQSLYKQYI